jgi:uncharacterized protein YejL (UPF0352 family)
MKVKDDLEKTLQFDPDKCNEMLSELMAIFQKHQPTVGEILTVYGNLGYSLGASIGGYQGKGPSPEELKQMYYEKPGRVDVALMLEGLTVTTWFEDWEKKQLTKVNQETKEES